MLRGRRRSRIPVRFCSALSLALMLGGCGTVTVGAILGGTTTTQGLIAIGEGCEDVADWDATSADYEAQVLTLINQNRAAGATCGETEFGAAEPLSMNADLRCAARRHSLDMAERDFFDHTNPDGDGPGQRIAATGYQPRTWGENIAWGQPTPDAVVSAWMNSPSHCSNIMNPSFTEVGVGHYTGSLWTQVFGAQ